MNGVGFNKGLLGGRWGHAPFYAYLLPVCGLNQTSSLDVVFCDDVV